MTWDDMAASLALADLHDEAVFARACREQAILVFVEGESEEVALPLLFTDILDLGTTGVKIANYNGHGNLRSALRLLRRTLEIDRPIIVTHDNDPDSVASVQRCKKQGLLGGSTYLFPIPQRPVVTYPTGYVGGSFEESFSVEIFLDCAFEEGLLPTSIMASRADFETGFDVSKPWFDQLREYTATSGFIEWSLCKPKFAERLALASDDLPPTFSRLVDTILEVRRKHPVIHPHDVELPKVYGLTFFPEGAEDT